MLGPVREEGFSAVPVAPGLMCAKTATGSDHVGS